MKRTIGMSVLACGLLLAGAGVVRADEPQNIRQEIQDLQARLTSLEAKLVEREHAMPATGGEGGLPQFIPGVKMSGYVETSYTYNFNRPDSLTNTLRVFDTRDNSFTVNSFFLNFTKPVSAESRAGFTGSFMVGKDGKVVGGVTNGFSGTDDIELIEAYGELLTPLGNGLDIKAGKFVTLHGAEVIDSRSVWNFSRSYLFGYAIPFTHTGVRLSYPWADWLTTMVGVSNGWDIVDDNNKAKTLEFSASLTPTKTTSLTATYMFGGEAGTNGNSNDRRQLLDIVAGWNPTEQLALKLNYDFGWEHSGLTSNPQKNAEWQGIALYGRYQWLPWWATALRWEWFNDLAAVRTAQTGRRGLHLYEWTLTNEFKIYKDMIGRLEYRHDSANERVFTRNKSATSYQDTIAMELIYPF